MPEAVYKEATAKGKPQADALKKYLQNKVADIDLSEFIIAAQGLGKGEMEAMALYKYRHADRLLIDDLRARKTASCNNIKIIGSIGILLRAKDHGLISKIKPCLDIIRNSEIYLSNNLIREALKLAGEKNSG